MVTELMKQPQYQPLPVWEMRLTLFRRQQRLLRLDRVKKALAADKSLRDHMKDKYASLVKTMEDKKDLRRRRRESAQGRDRGLEEKRNVLMSGYQGNKDEDPECAEHPEDHQGDGDGRRLQDAEGAGAHAPVAPLRREDPATSPRTSATPTPSTGTPSSSSATR